MLSDATLNLWDGIREDAIAYFSRNQIAWWRGSEEQTPPGHLLSSQVACVNHLYFARQRADVATAILKSVDDSIDSAVVVDDGFVEFEVIGGEDYLNERNRTRGANCTSVDAMMVGRRAGGDRVLVLIEWKYTESYGIKDLYVQKRAERYDSLMSADGSPITIDDTEALYYEPFYQLMRQTLLGSEMVKHEEYGARDFVHVHVVPDGNSELRETVTSSALKRFGDNVSDAWKAVLARPERFVSLDPEQLLAPVLMLPDTQSAATYLRNRYW